MKNETVLDAPAPRLPLATPLLAGCVLAAVAGWVDTLGFLGLHGVFTAHVTGNFVLLGTELAGDASEVVAKVLVLPIFLAGVACAASLHALLRGRSAPLLWLEVLGLACFLGAGAGGATLVAACAGAFAMGVQNAHCRLAASAMGATTAMTGNVTQLVLDAMGAAGLLPADRAQARRRLAATLAPVMGFAAGCAGGGFACLAWSFWALLAPLGALAVLAVCAESLEG